MPSDKEPHTRRLIDGLKLVEAASLPKEFSRFEKDDLYFIRHCQYSNFAKGTTHSLHEDIAKATQTQQAEILQAKSGGGSGAAGSSSNAAAANALDPTEDWVPRCIALTPAALFITDASANLYRATKYENIRELGFQLMLKKKLFGSEKRLYLNFKSETEPDCYLFMDAEEAKDFAEIFGKVMAARRPKGFTMMEIPESTQIREYVSTAIPAGFLTAQEIQRLNQNRVDINEHINNILQEVNNVQKVLDTLRPDADEKRAVLRTMEGATTDDLTQLRRRRQELHETHTSLQRSTVAMGTENNKIQQDVARANEQYNEDKANYEKLVSESVNVADNAALKEQNNMTLLRQKAQKREADKLSQKLDELSAELNTRPITYSGHDVFAAKAKLLEVKIAENLEKWSREMETANKLDKFIDNMTTDIDRVDEQLDLQYQKKMELIVEIEKRLGVVAGDDKKDKKKSVVAAAPTNTTVANDSFENDSFGIGAIDGSVAPPTNRPRGGAIASTTSGGSAAGAHGASMMVHGGGLDLDDDLLGGTDDGGAPTVTAPAAPAIADDIDDI